jgi:hypothetical protein
MHKSDTTKIQIVSDGLKYYRFSHNIYFFIILEAFAPLRNLNMEKNGLTTNRMGQH